MYSFSQHFKNFKLIRTKITLLYFIHGVNVYKKIIIEFVITPIAREIKIKIH